MPELRRLPAGQSVLPWHMGLDHWVLYTYEVATQAMRGHYMTLRERWGGWRREPFTSDSRKHVSIWEKPARRTSTPGHGRPARATRRIG